MAIQYQSTRNAVKPVFRVFRKSDTNWPVQSQKQARSLKFWIQVEEGLYYLCSKNKGADQLCSYCTADLRLCFSHMHRSGFLMTRFYPKTLLSIFSHVLSSKIGQCYFPKFTNGLFRANIEA